MSRCSREGRAWENRQRLLGNRNGWRVMSRHEAVCIRVPDKKRARAKRPFWRVGNGRDKKWFVVREIRGLSKRLEEVGAAK